MGRAGDGEEIGGKVTWYGALAAGMSNGARSQATPYDLAKFRPLVLLQLKLADDVAEFPHSLYMYRVWPLTSGDVQWVIEGNPDPEKALHLVGGMMCSTKACKALGYVKLPPSLQCRARSSRSSMFRVSDTLLKLAGPSVSHTPLPQHHPPSCILQPSVTIC